MNKNLIMKNKLFVLPVLMVLVTVFVSCGAKQPENGMEADNYSNKEILAMRKVYTDEEIAQNGWQKPPLAVVVSGAQRQFLKK